MTLPNKLNTTGSSRSLWMITPNFPSKTTDRLCTNKFRARNTWKKWKKWTCQFSPPKTAITRRRKTRFLGAPSTNQLIPANTKKDIGKRGRIQKAPKSKNNLQHRPSNTWWGDSLLIRRDSPRSKTFTGRMRCAQAKAKKRQPGSGQAARQTWTTAEGSEGRRKYGTLTRATLGQTTTVKNE